MNKELKALAVARMVVTDAVGRHILDDTSDKESADWANREHLLAKAHKEIEAEEKEVVQGYVSYSSGDYIERGEPRKDLLENLSTDTVEFVIKLIDEYKGLLNDDGITKIGTELDSAKSIFKMLLL